VFVSNQETSKYVPDFIFYKPSIIKASEAIWRWYFGPCTYGCSNGGK